MALLNRIEKGNYYLDSSGNRFIWTLDLIPGGGFTTTGDTIVADPIAITNEVLIELKFEQIIRQLNNIHKAQNPAAGFIKSVRFSDGSLSSSDPSAGL